MIVRTSFHDLPADGTPMRTLIAEPGPAGRYPGIVLWSDIFALTPSTIRSAIRLASYGFIVAAPEFYHRTEPAGTAIPFEDRDHAFRAADVTTVANYDADTRTIVGYLGEHPRVRPRALGTIGFCIGGHLATRAALQPEIAAAVAFYPTGLHDGKLGGNTGVDTLARAEAGEITGSILLAFGAKDPHVPLDAIGTIYAAFAKSGTNFRIAMYDGEHAFMRDEGERYNPSETDRAYLEAAGFFGAVLGGIG